MDRELYYMLTERGIPHAVMSSLVGASSLSVSRQKGLVRALEQAPKGDTAEIGCKTGGTSRLMALANGGRRHWVCDTFTGLVDCGPWDGKLTNRMFASPRSVAEQWLFGLGNVRIVEGIFPQSAPPDMEAARFGVVHIDVDTYKSTKASFEFFADRMVPGGILVMDDVLWPGPPGAIAVLDELLVAGRVTIIERNPPQAVVRLGV